MRITAILRRWADAIRHRLRLRRGPDHDRPVMAFTFAAMGRIAKADGRVRESHVRQIEALIRKISSHSADRERAIEWFGAGKTGSFDFEAGALRCRQTLDERAPLRRLCLEWMLLMAWVDGPPSDEERAVCTTLADLIGATNDERTSVEASVKAQRLRELPQPLREAYEILDADPWIDDEGLTLAYRRLVSRHHPDKFAQSGVDHAMESARRRTIAIREAYDLIRDSRSAA